MTLVIGHRGFSARYPENTCLAFRKAKSVGCDGVEFDVRSTKDGHLVVFHDKSLYRLTGLNQKLSETTFEQLSKLRVGDERIPTLAEALDCCRGLRFIILEVKVSGFEEEILDIVMQRKVESELIMSSSDASVLRRFRQLSHDLRLAYVMDNRPDRIRTWRKLKNDIKLFSVHYFHERPLFTQRFIRKLQSNGLKAIPWFLINTEQESRMRKLIARGVDGIITDHPDVLRRLLEKKTI